MKSRILRLLAAALLAGPMAANAAPITLEYQFEATDFGPGFNEGTVAPQATVTGTARVTIDPDRITPAPSEIPLDSIDLSIAGYRYNLSEVAVGLTLTSRGTEIVMLFGGLVNGIRGAADFTNDFVLSFLTDLAGNPTSSAIFLYRIESSLDGWVAGSGIPGSVRVVLNPAEVPEPATLALLGLGLVGMGYARRKKAS